ncbi:hypothetical protein B0H17DRAFT_563389 [Mycena rosella]|uniref:HNH nuclease domain-containing protein n=1 Tax=Mycena rosella TaxID=1033263 RepID=A0AAD7FLA3_MYCRO|nr:hypothetical protein B0H17DRAFT_563389 [Mycena rosella]
MSNYQSLQTPSARSVFDNDEDNEDRQSLSSADVSADGVLEDATLEETPQAPARAANLLYATPQARSATSSIATRAKENLEKVSPRKRCCIVTNEEFPRAAIEAAHLLPRAADHELLTKLEYAFNLKYKQLHIDTTRNLAYLRADQHRSFDRRGFLLLPTREVLLRVHTFTLSAKEAAKTYKEVFNETEFEYRIVPLQLFEDGNTVFRKLSDVGPQYESIFPLPNAEILPTLKSHVNPFFVIANAGSKLAPSMVLVPEAIKKNHDIFNDLVLLRALWDAWSLSTPPAMWKGAKYIPRRGGGNKDDGEGNDGRGPSDGRPPERPSTRSSSSRHDGSPTPSQGSRGAGRTVRRTEACLPNLEPDDRSDGVDSDLLTEDAVRLVPYLDRRFFVRNWLDGKPVHSDEDQVQWVSPECIEI